MEKLYVNEIRPDGEVSTVGLFYSRSEAEAIVAQLRSLPEKADRRYEIIEAVAGFASTTPQTKGITKRRVSRVALIQSVIRLGHRCGLGNPSGSKADPFRVNRLSTGVAEEWSA